MRFKFSVRQLRKGLCYFCGPFFNLDTSVYIIGYIEYPHTYETKYEHSNQTGRDEQINEIAGDSVRVAVKHAQLIYSLRQNRYQERYEGNEACDKGQQGCHKMGNKQESPMAKSHPVSPTEYLGKFSPMVNLTSNGGECERQCKYVEK